MSNYTAKSPVFIKYVSFIICALVGHRETLIFVKYQSSRSIRFGDIRAQSFRNLFKFVQQGLRNFTAALYLEERIIRQQQKWKEGTVSNKLVL